MIRGLACLALVGCTTSVVPAPPLAPLDAPTLAGSADAIALAIDEDGRVLAAVASALGSGERVSVLEEQSQGLTLRAWPGALDAVTDMPSVATGPGGVAAIAIRAGADGATADVLVARRLADGTWLEPARDDIASLPPRAYEPRVVFEPSGALLLVTNQGAAARDGYGVSVSRAPSAADPFVRPRDADDVISPPLFFSNSPRPALDPAGAAIISWYQSLGGPLLVLFAERSDPEGAFVPADPETALSIASSPVDSSGAPDPAMGRDGSAAVAWTQGDGRGGIGVYFARRAPGESFERPSSLDDRLSLGDGSARSPQARIADDGTLLIAWSERIAERERVFLASLAAGAPRSSARVSSISAPDADAYAPALAVSARGELALAFVERTATSARIVLRRGASDGTLGAREVVAEGADVGSPTLAFGTAHARLVLAWIDAGAARFAATAR